MSVRAISRVRIAFRSTDALLVGGFALLLLAVLPPGNVSSDGASMLAVTRALATHGSVSIACSLGSLAGRGGRCYSTYYPLNSVLAVPFFLLGDGIGHLAHVSATFVGNAAAQILPALSAALAAVLTVKFAARFGASRAQAVLAGVTLVLATEMAVYERTFFADALLTALVSLEVWLLCSSRRRELLFVIVVALTILAKPQAFLVGPLLAIDAARSARSWRPVILAAAGSALGALIYGIYDDIRFSSFTNLGGSQRALHLADYAPLHLIKTVALLTISPGRGLFVFSPICILGFVICVRRRREPLARAALIVMTALLVICVGSLGGGDTWASRYLAPTLPLFVAAAWSSRGRALILAGALSILGAVIEFPTFVGFFQRYYIEGDSHHIDPTDRYWSFLHTPLIGVWGSMVREVNDAVSANLHTLVSTNAGGTSASAQRFFHVVSEWWWMVPLAHVPRPVGALVALGLAAGGLLLLRAWSRRHGLDGDAVMAAGSAAGAGGLGADAPA